MECFKVKFKNNQELQSCLRLSNWVALLQCWQLHLDYTVEFANCENIQARICSPYRSLGCAATKSLWKLLRYRISGNTVTQERKTVYLVTKFSPQFYGESHWGLDRWFGCSLLWKDKSFRLWLPIPWDLRLDFAVDEKVSTFFLDAAKLIYD